MSIILISAKNENRDNFFRLTTGVDDYLTEPFNPLELVTRVKTQLRTS